MEDQGYEWIETTPTPGMDVRTFIRGRKLNEDRAALVRLRGNVRRFADVLAAEPRWVRSTEIANDLKGIAE